MEEECQKYMGTLRAFRDVRREAEALAKANRKEEASIHGQSVNSAANAAMKDTNVQLKREVASLREQLAELMLNVTWPTGCYASRPLQAASKRRSVPDPQAAATKEKLRQITGPFMLRRRKTDPNIVPDLPDKVEMAHEVELSAFQRKLYKAVQETYEQDRAKLAGSGNYKFERGAAICRMLHGLREICNHPACLDEKRRPKDIAAKDYPSLDSHKASGKSEKLHELLEEQVFANNEKVLIFSTSLSAIDMLAQQIRKRFNCEPLILKGDVSMENREATVRSFQNDARCSVLLLSVGADLADCTPGNHRSQTEALTPKPFQLAQETEQVGFK
ncbi:ywqA [Symbiodinium natans]|uniref:YwqA protein n=1 Tax=Symbiodinium natans TaxID=878477 RepID=A0A812SM25_9DINO|nr:ywqA [Symbiodinium natans]